MIYTFDTRIRFSEVDENEYLKCENFINYFQDCSTFQSEDLGLGLDYLRENRQVWVLTSWQIEIIRYPKLCDRVTVGTMAYDFKSFLGYRNFFMKDENGEMIAKANSIWVLLSTQTGRPVKPSEKQLENYGKEEKLDMNYLSRKIDVPDNLKKMGEIIVTESHLDTNHHVNNGQFVKMAVASINGEKRPEGIRVEYKNQAYLSDRIHVFSDGKVVDMRNEEGDSYCVVEIV